MADAIGIAMLRLQKSAGALNELTNVASECVKDVERFLEGCSLGLSAAVMFFEDREANANGYLEYRRIGRSFRVAVVYGEHSDDEYVRPWSDCPRDLKLETFAKLPDLLNKIADSVDDQIARSKKTVAEIRKSIPSNPAAKEVSDDIPF